MGKQALRKSEIKELNSRLSFFEIPKKSKVESDGGVIYLDGSPVLFFFNGNPAPHLKLLLESDLLKNAVVDMRSIKFLVNGADVMRPGIVRIDKGIKKDEFVSVRDEKYCKPICVCVALFSGEEISGMSNGKVLKNIHFVGDDLWKKD